MNLRTSTSRCCAFRGLSAGSWAADSLAAGRRLSIVAWVLPVLLVAAGCRPESDIVQYEIDTRQPEELQVEQRMIGAIVPQPEAVWFFKIVGPASDVDGVAEEVRQWVAKMEFEEGSPVLELPAEWTRRDGGAMRFATVEIPTDQDLPLEMSISQLSRGEDWSELVAMNVNRWRGQMGLESSEEPWAGGEPLAGESSVAEEGEVAVWVDLTGTFGGGPSSMPPFASQLSPDGPLSTEGAGMPFNRPAGDAATSSAPAPAATGAGTEGAGETESEAVTYETPEGWRPGKMSAMRWAAFNVGPEDRAAELTVIPAGGDVRGNVHRWLGQIRPDGVDDALLDAVIEEAKEVTVDGRAAQRFLLPGSGDDPSAIDVTIVPLEEGRSLFIKLTGDAETVAEQSDELGQFLESFQINR